MDDLLAPLAPPAADVARPGGMIRGPEGWRVALDGVAAGLEAWVPWVGAWVPVGAALLGGGCGTVCCHGGRLMLSMTFDLGAAPRRRSEDDEGEA